MIDPRLEHFLLFDLEDDWMPIGSFVGLVRRVTPHDCSMERVAAIIEEFAQKGWMTIGGWSTETRTWEPWMVPLSVAMERITGGYDGEAGLHTATEDRLGSTEVFRGEITAAGRSHLQTLGSPYEKYGDPWAGDGLYAAEGNFPKWQP